MSSRLGHTSYKKRSFRALWERPDFQASAQDLDKLKAFPATFLGLPIIAFDGLVYADFCYRKLTEYGLLRNNYIVTPKGLSLLLILRIFAAKALRISPWTRVHELVYQSIHFRFRGMELDMSTDELLEGLAREDLLIFPALRELARLHEEE